MLRAYIYNHENDNFEEIEDNLLYHDICLILDEERKSIFLWKGPEITKNLLIKARTSLKSVLTNYSDFKLVELEDSELLPSNVKDQINKLLKGVQEKEFIEKYKFSRLVTIRLFLLLELIGIGLSFAFLGFLSSIFNWLVIGGVDSATFEIWLLGLRIPVLTNIFVYILIFIIGVFEREDDIIIISITSVLISIIISIYLTQGVFLFIFQEGSSSDFYVISPIEIVSFFFVNLFACLIISVPNVIKLIGFIRMYREYIFL